MSELAVVTKPAAPDLSKIEAILIKGDLSALTAEQRVVYYNRVCETAGLNPLTRPFDYITLSGKLVLYATKGCAEQLRAIHRISVHKIEKEQIGDLFIVTAYVRNAAGREDSSTGAVSTAGLKGEMLANAIMKSETKAKRRATLSICGLNMLDDTEVESVKAVEAQQGKQILPERVPVGNGNTEPLVYKIPFGKWAQRTLEDVYKNFGPEEMASYIAYIEKDAAKKGKDVSPMGMEFIARVEAFLGLMESKAHQGEQGLFDAEEGDVP